MYLKVAWVRCAGGGGVLAHEQGQADILGARVCLYGCMFMRLYGMHMVPGFHRHHVRVCVCESTCAVYVLPCRCGCAEHQMKPSAPQQSPALLWCTGRAATQIVRDLCLAYWLCPLNDTFLPTITHQPIPVPPPACAAFAALHVPRGTPWCHCLGRLVRAVHQLPICFHGV
jgi:hypothetical protein